METREIRAAGSIVCTVAEDFTLSVTSQPVSPLLIPTFIRNPLSELPCSRRTACAYGFPAVTGPKVAERLASLASHQGEPGSIPGRVTPGFSYVRIVQHDAAGRWVFSGISASPHSFSFRRYSILNSITLIGSQDLAVKSRPNPFTHSYSGFQPVDAHGFSLGATVVLGGSGVGRPPRSTCSSSRWNSAPHAGDYFSDRSVRKPVESVARRSSPKKEGMNGCCARCQQIPPAARARSASSTRHWGVYQARKELGERRRHSPQPPTTDKPAVLVFPFRARLTCNTERKKDVVRTRNNARMERGMPRGEDWRDGQQRGGVWVSEEILAALNSVVLRADEAARNEGAGKREIPEKTRRPTASSSTIPTCQDPVTQPGIEPDSKDTCPLRQTQATNRHPAPFSPNRPRKMSYCAGKSSDGIRPTR
ncbi:hypothetical protein PR048_018996 [Dryococelus australis]|uniref:Uncharacterized protein n=1 Tax=Dryococelus australis TaxID=614101 RepID=A0ABQ9H2A8_9NEOP|nr:hypothetical protein PR048_018996 [Dryococelus australis]